MRVFIFKCFQNVNIPVYFMNLLLLSKTKWNYSKFFSETQEKIAKTRRKREATPNANEASTSRSGTGTETAQGGDRTNPEGSRKGKKQRKHQNRASHTGSQSDNLCSRRSLYVDFEELNWQDWIMAPSQSYKDDLSQ